MQIEGSFGFKPGIEQNIINTFTENFDNHVLFEDGNLLVIDKPGGIASTRGPHYGVASVVLEVRGEGIYPVHRLDKETSGILILGKTRSARASLGKQFEKRTIRKKYVALVDELWNRKLSGIIAPLETENCKTKVSLSTHAKKAATSFNEIAQFVDEYGKIRTLLLVHIFTGRTHQIRAHLNYLDAPIIGDKLYNNGEGSYVAPRQLLHAFEIQFRYPGTEEYMTLRAPLPHDFIEFISSMKVGKQTSFFQEVHKG